MKQARRTEFLLRTLLVLLGMGLSACARNDYNPTVYDVLRTNNDQAKQTHSLDLILIRRGDTLYGIARRHGIPIRKLIEENRLSPPYVIYPGNTLKKPDIKIHISRVGETAYGVARRYNLDMGALVRINHIQPPYRLRSGQKLRLPDRLPKTFQSKGPFRGQKVSRVYPNHGLSNTDNKLKNIRRVSPRKWSKALPRSLKTRNRSGGQNFLWPVKGKIIVGFGPRKGGFHNDGINILARAGTPVRSAESGTVIYVGNQLQGFGNLVLIKHLGGWISAYAHGSLVLVKRGTLVRRGQVIAKVGRTGNVDRPQLHFELRRGDEAVDPRRYLVRFAQVGSFRRFVFLNDQQDPE